VRDFPARAFAAKKLPPHLKEYNTISWAFPRRSSASARLAGQSVRGNFAAEEFREGENFGTLVEAVCDLRIGDEVLRADAQLFEFDAKPADERAQLLEFISEFRHRAVQE
jgi:hypothetical protein